MIGLSKLGLFRCLEERNLEVWIRLTTILYRFEEKLELLRNLNEWDLCRFESFQIILIISRIHSGLHKIFHHHFGER